MPQVLSVKLLMGSDGRPRGMGVVSFATAEAAARVRISFASSTGSPVRNSYAYRLAVCVRAGRGRLDGPKSLRKT
jgi:hypothetical protein